MTEQEMRLVGTQGEIERMLVECRVVPSDYHNWEGVTVGDESRDTGSSVNA